MSSLNPLYHIHSIPNKGLGLLASQPLKPGQLLISEPALFTTASLSNPDTTETDLSQILKTLPKPSQREFLTLHNNFPGKPSPFSNIIRSNGYPLGPSSPIGGIFLQTARLNHACRPNAQHAWNAKLQRMVVHAVRAIEAGEEITLSYIPGGPSATRQAMLRENFGFGCTCEVCALEGAEREVSDERLERAGELDEAIGDPKRVRLEPGKVLRDCHALLRIYREEEIFDLRLPRLYYDAFQICAMHGDQARASVLAGRARELRIVCEGEESTEAENLEGLRRDPKMFENFGVTGKWKSKVDGVPSNLDEKAFEAWLWKLS